MIPAGFEYHRPQTLEQALELMSSLPDAKLLAGGMSLIPALKHRLVQPSALIDIGRIPELDQVSQRRGRFRIGGRATHAALADSHYAEYPILGETALQIGDVQVRNRGTVGGSLVHADPAADWPAVFLAVDGEATMVGPAGERKLAAGDFFSGMLTSAVASNEVLTEINLHFERKRAGAAYCKLRQSASGFAVVGVAAQVVLDRKGRCEQIGIGVTGVNPVPFRATSLESRLLGVKLADADLGNLCGEISELDPMGDLHASAEYRFHVASVYASRAVRAACERVKL